MVVNDVNVANAVKANVVSARRCRIRILQREIQKVLHCKEACGTDGTEIGGKHYFAIHKE